MNQFDKVKVNFEFTRYITDDMRDWILEHKDVVFKIEKIVDNSIKLFKVNFWITEDLLIKIQ